MVLGGRYRLVDRLGSGGMGSVWRAQDLNLGGEVAIKLIDPALANSQEALARFRREAQAAAAIRSTYVVQTMDHGIDGGTPFIAMELLHGESLAARLARVGRLQQSEAARILGHVGRALDLAHSKHIVHRDMKPENIFLVREGDEDVGKVLDFGIARSNEGFADTGGWKTQTATILGTPYYMSAEQATGQDVDHRTDIWAFGVIAYECLLGQRVFRGDSIGSLFHAICIAELPVPSERGIVPAGFDEWFARAVARDRAARYQTIKEACDDFRAVCGRVSGRASAPDGLPGASNRAVAITPPRPSDERSTATPTHAFEQTAPPSAHTIRMLARRKSIVALVVAIPLLLVFSSLGYFAWHRSGHSSVAIEPSSAELSTAPMSRESTLPATDARTVAASTNAAALVIPVPDVDAPVAPASASADARVPSERRRTTKPPAPAPMRQSGSAAPLPSSPPHRRNVSGL